MTNSDSHSNPHERNLTPGQWFILALLLLLNGAVLVLLILALTGRLAL